MKVSVIGPTLNTYFGVEEIAKYHEIKALFTLPANLGIKKARYTTFEDQAGKYHFEIFYEEHNLKDENVIKKFKDLNLDLIIELGSSKIIPPEIIESAKYGCIGSHGGKLPYIRGGASMNWALINGEKDWGVSIYYLTPGVDEGKLIATKDFKIEERDDINSVHSKSDLATAIMLGKFLKNFKPKEELPKQEDLDVIKLSHSPKEYNWEAIVKWNKDVKEQYQKSKNSGKAVFLPQRKPQDGFIDWNSYSLEIYNFIRAQIPPFPGAFTLYKNKKLFIHKSDAKRDYYDTNNKPGQIISVDKEGILVKALNGYINLEKLRLENQPEMWGDDFFYENKLKIGDVFGK
jgi:methionyl-tRNA formyltransferase